VVDKEMARLVSSIALASPSVVAIFDNVNTNTFLTRDDYDDLYWEFPEGKVAIAFFKEKGKLTSVEVSICRFGTREIDINVSLSRSDPLFPSFHKVWRRLQREHRGEVQGVCETGNC